jgi:hypothetical protein
MLEIPTKVVSISYMRYTLDIVRPEEQELISQGLAQSKCSKI